ncbi:MAG: hypothetical protein ACK5MT_19385 [Actinomycetales bacterium]
MAGESMSVESLAAELSTLRRRGIRNTRDLPIPGLLELARDHEPKEATHARCVAAMLKRAIGTLPDQQARVTLTTLFGISTRTPGGEPTELRARAAAQAGKKLDTFRRTDELQLIAELAEALLELPPPGGAAETGLASSRIRVSRIVESDGSAATRIMRFGPFPLPEGGASRIVVDWGPAEQLTDVLVIVSSENTYLQPARMFSSTLSGHLRRAAALIDADGGIAHDVVADELAAWMSANAGIGGQVAAGRVVATSAGRLSGNGVQALLHAAVAQPQVDRNGYEVSQVAVTRAVGEIFRMAVEYLPEAGTPAQRRAATAATGPAGAIAIPLFGTGEGGLTISESLDRLIPPLLQRLRRTPAWQVHLTTWTAAETLELLERLEAEGLR